MGVMRYYPCSLPGCPDVAVKNGRCLRHARTWVGRNGSTRREAMGVSETTWGKLKRAVARRDGGSCRICGAPAVEVDHVIPVAWRKPPSSFKEHLAVLMALCQSCHGIKTREEAVTGRLYGSPPALHHIEAHVRRWGAHLVVK